MSQNVVIDDLQVGMFVHLDLGWWAHPFALSSFLITSPDQIATIRVLQPAAGASSSLTIGLSGRICFTTECGTR